MSEDMDMADHLVAASKLAVREGMTKEQYLNAASVFWDSWVSAQEFFSQNDGKPLDPSDTLS